MLTDEQVIGLLIDTVNSISVEKDNSNIRNMTSLVNNYRTLKSILSLELNEANKSTIENHITYFQDLLVFCTELYNQSLTNREITQSNNLVRLINCIDSLLRKDSNEKEF